jgi:phenylacetate-CoA ligase
MHAGAELMGCTLVPVSGGQTRRQVTLRDLQPEVLCCTPSYAARLGEALGEAGLSREELSLRVGIFGAEPWSEGMRAQLQAVLPLKALDIYGPAGRHIPRVELGKAVRVAQRTAAHDPPPGWL